MQTISSLSSAKLVPGEEVTLVSLVQAIDRDNNLHPTKDCLERTEDQTR